MANQEINVGVSVPGSEKLGTAAKKAEGLESALKGAGDAADAAAKSASDLEGALDSVVDAAGAAGQAVQGVGESAAQAQDDFSGLAEMINDFMRRRAQVSGKVPRLFDAEADLDFLKTFRAEFDALVKDTRGLPNGLGKNLALTGQSGVKSPESIQWDKFHRDAQRQERAKDAMVLNLLGRAQGKHPIDLGQTADELRDRPHPSANVPQPGAGGGAGGGKPPDGKKTDADDDKDRGMMRAGRYLLSRVTAGAGEAGQVAGEAARGAGLGVMGAMPGGMLGGAAIGLAGFAAYKGVQAVSQGIDRDKQEAIEIDKLKRSMGGVGESFDVLRERTRAVGDQFSLTFEQSRRLMVEFARTALVGDRADRREMQGQVAEGAGLALAVGADPAEGTRLLASMRHDKAIGETQRDARIFGIQVAEAIKRSGSTLNAPDLMQALASYTHETTARSLGSTNVEGYAALVAAMAGSGTPGLDVRNAAALIGRADSAFSSGGRMGEASQTLQYTALGGDRLGPALTYARQEAGIFASDASTFGKDSQLARYFSENGGRSLAGMTGQETGLQQVMGMFDRSGLGAEQKLLAMRNHFGLSMSQTATLYNLRKEGKLDGTMGMVNSFNERAAPGDRVDMSKVSATGYSALADLSGRKSVDDLQALRAELADRKGLTADQSKNLQGLADVKDEGVLRDGLMKVVANLDRETTQGQRLEKAAADTSNSVQRIADMLIPAAVKSNEYLAALVEKLAPDSKEAKDIKEERSARDRYAFRERLENGEISADEVAKKNNSYLDKARAVVAGNGSEDYKQEQILALRKSQVEELGTRASTIKVPLSEGQKRPVTGSGRAPKFMPDAAQFDAVDARVETGFASFRRNKLMNGAEQAVLPRSVSAASDPRRLDGPIAGLRSDSVAEPVSEENAKRLDVTKLTPAQEAAVVQSSGGDQAKAEFMRNWLKIENRGHAAPRDDATSQAGAAGAFQFMPETARAVGLRVDSSVDERRDFFKSAKAASIYYDDLKRQHGGDLDKMYAGVNGSPALAAKAGRSGNRENDEYVAMSRHLRAVKASPPVPTTATVAAKTPASVPRDASMTAAEKAKVPPGVARASTPADAPKLADDVEIDSTKGARLKPPTQVPRGDPLAATETRKAEERQRMMFEFSPINLSANVNLAMAGGAPQQTVSLSGVVRKPQPSGAFA